MRRVFCALLVVALLPLTLLRPGRARAEETDPLENLEVPNCIVVDQNDPTIVLYERNADDKSIPGSTMKIMTCILSIELCTDLEQKVTITGQAASMKDTNSLMGVIRGEELTVRELLYGLMLESGNDAALMLALTFGGSVEGFAELMNQKAAELGMTNTYFINASGAYKSGQYSTARDMAILTCYAMKNELFRTLASTVHYTIEPNNVRKRSMEMTNSNKLISDPEDSSLFYEYATGVKTGSTELGGKCLVASATKDGASVIAVMLGVTEGGSKLARMSQVYQDSKEIMELALTERYASVTAEELGLPVSFEAEVEGGVEKTVQAYASFEEATVRLPDVMVEKIKADPSLVTVNTELCALTAPVSKDDICGSAVYTYEDRTLFTAELTTQSEISAPSAVPEATPAPTVVLTPEPVEEQKESGIPFWEMGLVAIACAAVLLIAVVIIREQKAKARKKKKRAKAALKARPTDTQK